MINKTLDQIIGVLSSYFADYAEGVENLQIELYCELLLLLNCCLFYLHITENKYRILLVSHFLI